MYTICENGVIIILLCKLLVGGIRIDFLDRCLFNKSKVLVYSSCTKVGVF